MKQNLNTSLSSLHLDESDLFIELSRHRLDEKFQQEILKKLVKEDIQQLFQDNNLNTTEHRSVTHIAWRDIKKQFKFSESSRFKQEQERAYQFVDDVTNGNYVGCTGNKITDVVNVGIGGSHLGNALTCEALKDFHHGVLRGHFLSSPDPDALKDLLKKIDLKKTLWLFTSKSFSTYEILVLIKKIKSIYKNLFSTDENVEKHFFAITSQVEKAKACGFTAEKCFWFDEGVGGRFSLWSTAGLMITLMIGKKNHQQLLAGAHAMDQHFKSMPLEENIPVSLACLDYYYQQNLNATSRVVIPYTTRLALLPNYLQQLEMESLGKHAHADGSLTDKEYGLVVWGDTGPNGQHAFHQFLYQNEQLIPIEFIALKKSSEFEELQTLQLAQCFAQAKALWEGTPNEKSNEKKVSGLNPSTIILLDRLDPYLLGKLLAMYEHKVFVLGKLYQINPFDQFGVELGKKLTQPMLDAFSDENAKTSLDNISQQLIDRVKK